MAEPEPILLKYRFLFEEGIEKVFDIHLHARSCRMLKPRSDPANYPDWTRLDYKQCRNCPLSKAEYSHCPVAVNLAEVVEFFEDYPSIQTASVSVETSTRIILRKQSKLFPGLSSMIGIFMVTSGCPIMDPLRPMARFHLPFADTDETIYRAFSMYALAQCLRQAKSQEPDWNFEKLRMIYSEINTLNIDFAQRLRNDSVNEATTNAITSLDCFAQQIDFSISEDMLDEIESLFEGYL